MNLIAEISSRLRVPLFFKDRKWNKIDNFENSESTF